MVYYLSLGSNLGDREGTIRQALQRIEQQIGPVRRCSSFYYSRPWGFESEHDFCNLCCAVETDKTPLEVLHLTQAIERALGRKKKTLISNPQSPIYSDRNIDIDLIRVFDEQEQEIHCEILNDSYLQSPTSNLQSPTSNVPLLSLPHPLWQQRNFVKIPLAEIMQP